MRSNAKFAWLAFVGVGVVGATAWGDQGTISKWLQRPFAPELVNPSDPMSHMQGENIWSDVDWRLVMTQPVPIEPNWIIADDFRSDGRPVLTVRWWGSYRPGFEPQPGPEGPILFEDGYVVSFFKDIPDPDGPTGPGFSMPGELLGTYVAPLPAVKIKPADLIGWDEHLIFEYEVNLQDTCLDHPTELTTPISFNEIAGEIYWLAINAEVGHRIERVVDTQGNVTWESVLTDKPTPHEHFWGWHTSPDHFNDVAVMGHLTMPTEEEWLYGPWEPIQPLHEFEDMAFELLVPEPTTLGVMVGVLGFVGLSRRRMR